jgi:hypothetical protein
MAVLESHSTDLGLYNADNNDGSGSDDNPVESDFSQNDRGTIEDANGANGQRVAWDAKESKRIAKENRRRLKTYQLRNQELEAENAEFHKQRRQFVRHKQFAASAQHKLDALMSSNSWFEGELTNLRLANARLEAKVTAANEAAATAEEAEARLRHEREALLEELHLMRHSTQEAEVHRTRAELLKRFVDKHAGSAPNARPNDYSYPPSLDSSSYAVVDLDKHRANMHGGYAQKPIAADGSRVTLTDSANVISYGAATRAAATADKAELDRLLDQVKRAPIHFISSLFVFASFHVAKID